MAAILKFPEPDSLIDLHEEDRLSALRTNIELSNFAREHAWLCGDTINSLAAEIGAVRQQMFAPDMVVILNAVREMLIRGGGLYEGWRASILDELDTLIRVAVDVSDADRAEIGDDVADDSERGL